MVKYADDSDKPHIRECFESIPKQLAKENKKFQYSVVKKGGGRLNTWVLFNGWRMQASQKGVIILRFPNSR